MKITDVPFKLSTTSCHVQRWIVTEPPPFGDGTPLTFPTARLAFGYLRNRGYILNEEAVAQAIADDERDH